MAYCGLICGLCRPDGGCSCKSGDNCGKRLSPQGCYQYSCCTERGLQGCWECEDAPCGRDMLAPGKTKIRAFVRCIREDGMENFLEYLEMNREKGVAYHRNGFTGDYDLETEEEVLQLLRSAKRE